jgi:Zinc finger, C3HC4 type (RING finger)
VQARDKLAARDAELQHTRSVALERLQGSGAAAKAALDGCAAHGAACIARMHRDARAKQAHCLEVSARQRFLENQLRQLSSALRRAAGDGAAAASGDADELLCPVCMSEMHDEIRLLPCGHSFCESCTNHLLASFNPCCPMDRRPFKRSQVRAGRHACKRFPHACMHAASTADARMQVFSAQVHAAAAAAGHAAELAPEAAGIAAVRPVGAWLTKIGALLRRVLHLRATAPTEKCLVFSQFPDALALVKSALAVNRIKAASITSNSRAVRPRHAFAACTRHRTHPPCIARHACRRCDARWRTFMTMQRLGCFCCHSGQPQRALR